jgi:hypothetical protein
MNVIRTKTGRLLIALTLILLPLLVIPAQALNPFVPRGSAFTHTDAQVHGVPSDHDTDPAGQPHVVPETFPPLVRRVGLPGVFPVNAFCTSSAWDGHCGARADASGEIALVAGVGWRFTLWIRLQLHVCHVGGWAWARGYASADPFVSTVQQAPSEGIIEIQKGFRLKAEGTAWVTCCITMVDMNTTATLWRACANFSTTGGLTVGGAWSYGDWVTTSTCAAYRGPAEFSVTLPTGDYVEQIVIAEGNATNTGSSASVEYMPVGGTVIPVDKLGLLTPYIGAAALVAVGAVIAAKKYKRKK